MFKDFEHFDNISVDIHKVNVFGRFGSHYIDLVIAGVAVSREDNSGVYPARDNHVR
jgi:hypothetical protein